MSGAPPAGGGGGAVAGGSAPAATRSSRSAAYDDTRETLRRRPQRWLVTGAAGFIGSHLLETLLRLDQTVVGLDNLSTGYRRNLDDVHASVGDESWRNFTFIEGDIRDLATCRRACDGATIVLHQAALGSVPRSIDDPMSTHDVNCTGFVNMLVASRDARVARFVYAASSSTYGDHPALPKVEDTIGAPLSPYAVTKLANELYANVFARCYGIATIGLRYFNIFGPRQDPGGAYAAVIPRWIAQLARNEPVYVNGDGSTSRDFCFVDNAVQANLLAATTERADALNKIYNVAVSERTTLLELFEMQRELLAAYFPSAGSQKPQHREFREGDVLHSQADITRARTLLGYEPTHRIRDGLERTVQWYVGSQSRG